MNHTLFDTLLESSSSSVEDAPVVCLTVYSPLELRCC
jgi:hypothetical protein